MAPCRFQVAPGLQPLSFEARADSIPKAPPPFACLQGEGSGFPPLYLYDFFLPSAYLCCFQQQQAVVKQASQWATIREKVREQELLAQEVFPSPPISLHSRRHGLDSNMID